MGEELTSLQFPQGQKLLYEDGSRVCLCIVVVSYLLW